MNNQFFSKRIKLIIYCQYKFILFDMGDFDKNEAILQEFGRIYLEDV